MEYVESSLHTITPRQYIVFVRELITTLTEVDFSITERDLVAYIDTLVQDLR